MKLVCTYVGAIIGAGFASGREIVIFFNNNNIFTLILAALFLAVVFAIFLISKKINNVFFDVIQIASMIVTYSLMVSALNDVSEQINIYQLVVIISVISIFVGSINNSWLKFVNLICVLAILVLVVYLSNFSHIIIVGHTSIKQAIFYCGMNTLLGGFIVTNIDTKINKKDIIVSAIMVFVIFSILFICVAKIAFLNIGESLPMLKFAIDNNAKTASIIIISTAIFTTQISAVRVIFINMNRFISKNFIFMFMLSILILSMNIPYFNYSKMMYPILGYIGCTHIIFSIILLLKKEFSFNKFSNALNSKIHYGGHNT